MVMNLSSCNRAVFGDHSAATVGRCFGSRVHSYPTCSGAPTGQFGPHRVEIHHDRFGFLAIQELWSLLMTLVATSAGGAQQALYGVLLTLLMDAMAPETGDADSHVAGAAYQVFKAGLQSPKMAHMLPSALRMLSAGEKARLREGIKATEGQASAGSSRLATPTKPTINFAAFKAK